MMFQKSLATLAIAGSILASNVGIVSADDDHSSKGVEHQEIRDEGRHNGKDKKAASTTPVDGACMAAAVDVRDTAVIAGLDTYYTAVKASLVARKGALKAAWVLTDTAARKTAVKAAWDAFRGTWKASAKTLNTARKAAWDVFKTSSKVCGGHGEEHENAGGDMKL